jgi:hypothetical protein
MAAAAGRLPSMKGQQLYTVVGLLSREGAA